MTNILRLALIAITFCCIPQEGICLSDKATRLIGTLFDHADARDFQAMEDDLTELANHLISEDSITEVEGYLEAFVAELNSRYGHSFTVKDLCRLTRENLHLFELPAEIKNGVREALQELESK